MSRTKKFLYNSISTATLQIITMIVGFITPKIMLETYGSEINGLVSSINQFISYFNLVEAGLASAAIYALYKPLAYKDYDEINGVVSAAKNFYVLSGYIFVTLIIGLATIYPIFIKSSNLSSIMISTLVMILGVSGALEFFTMAKYRVLLTADQKTYVLSIASIVAILLNTIIIVVLAKMKINIVLLRFFALFSIFVRSIILSIYVNFNYKSINYNANPNKKALNKRWDALYLQFLGAVQNGGPTVIATMFTNLSMVSVYSIFNMVMSGLNGVLSIFISGLSSSFGNIIACKEIDTLQNNYNKFEFIYYNLITIVYSIAMIMIMPFINIYTYGIDDINYNIPILGFLFVLNGLLYNIKTPQGMLVISAGMYKETRIQSTIQALIIVIGGIILAPIYNLTGILIACCLSNLYRDIDLLFFVPNKITKLDSKITFNRQVRIFISFTIICITFYFIKINPTNYIEWFIDAIIVGIYGSLVTLLISFIFDRKVLKESLIKVKSVVGTDK